MSIKELFKGLFDKGKEAIGLSGTAGTGGKPIKDGRDDIAVISEFDNLLDDAIDSKQSYEQTWFLNLAWLLGNQYTEWNPTTKKYQEPKIPPWRVQLVVNKLLGRYMDTLTGLTSFEPRLVVTPNSSENMDKEAASLGTKLLRCFKNKLDWKAKNKRKSQWQLLCGSAGYHFFWNPSLGKPVKDSNNNVVARDSEATPAEATSTDELPKVKKLLMTGDVDIEVWNSFELFPLDNASCIEDCQRMMWVKYVPLDTIHQLYPTKVVAAGSDSDNRITYFMDKIETLSSSALTDGGTSARGADMVLYKRVWERPSSKYPKGRYVAYANGMLLEYTSVPDVELGKEFEIPFVKYDELEVVGRFWGQAIIEQQRPINREINKTRSQEIEARNLMSKPKWVAVAGTVAENSMTSEPGEVLEWNPMAVPAEARIAPHTIPGAPMPDVDRLNQRLERDLADVGFHHDVSQGTNVDSNVTSGKAILALREGDERKMGPMMQQVADNDKVVASALLKLAQKHYEETRVEKVVGENNETEVIEFTKADLSSNTDVLVEDTDFLPQTRRGRQLLVMELYKDGLLGNVDNDETRRRAIRMMQDGYTEELWDDGSDSAKEARYENSQLAKGIWVEPEWYNNHEAHINEHKKPLNSPLFKQQPDKVRLYMEAHAKRTLLYMAGGQPPPRGIPLEQETNKWGGETTGEVTPNIIEPAEEAMGEEQLPMEEPMAEGQMPMEQEQLPIAGGE